MIHAVLNWSAPNRGTRGIGVLAKRHRHDDLRHEQSDCGDRGEAILRDPIAQVYRSKADAKVHNDGETAMLGEEVNTALLDDIARCTRQSFAADLLKQEH